MANNCTDTLFFDKKICGTSQVNIRIGYSDDSGRTTIFRNKTVSTPVHVRNDTKNPADNPEETKMDVKVLNDGLWFPDSVGTYHIANCY